MPIKSFKLNKNSTTLWGERASKMTFKISGSSSEDKKAKLDNARSRSFAKGGRALVSGASQAAESTKAFFRDSAEKYSAQRKGNQDRDASYFLKRGTAIAIKSPLYAGMGVGMGVALAGKGIAEGSSWTSAAVYGAGKTVAINTVPVMAEAAHKAQTAGVTLGAVFGVYAAAEQAGKAYGYTKESARDTAAYMHGWTGSVARTFSTAANEGRRSRDSARVARHVLFGSEDSTMTPSLSPSTSRKSSQSLSSINTVSTDELFELPLPTLTGASLGINTQADSFEKMMLGAGYYGNQNIIGLAF